MPIVAHIGHAGWPSHRFWRWNRIIQSLWTNRLLLTASCLLFILRIFKNTYHFISKIHTTPIDPSWLLSRGFCVSRKCITASSWRRSLDTWVRHIITMRTSCRSVICWLSSILTTAALGQCWKLNSLYAGWPFLWNPGNVRESDSCQWNIWETETAVSTVTSARRHVLPPCEQSGDSLSCFKNDVPGAIIVEIVVYIPIKSVPIILVFLIAFFSK